MRFVMGALTLLLLSDRSAGTEPFDADEVAKIQKRIASIATRIVPPGGPWTVRANRTLGTQSMFVWKVEEGDMRGSHVQVSTRVFEAADEARNYLEKVNNSSQMRATKVCTELTDYCLTLARRTPAEESCRSYRLTVDKVWMELSGCDKRDEVARAFVKTWVEELKKDDQK